ncbi:hypothetical protein Dsin_001276 [Dipteronia sinensis]|uniref:RNase H type-1 domain-containing protein n=1 Tax=Dipteronia sinensis TaxID=43782 RepID=A0AAE0B4Y4_9ROSI|nr:hypothetical protein Dsin_001276 [Dipteronia sinensis]
MEGNRAINRVGRVNGSGGRGQGSGVSRGVNQLFNLQMDRFYAEALIGNQEESKAQGTHDNPAIMNWEGTQLNEVWLSKCAVGVLKHFSDLSSVNHRLSNRGFTFYSHYMGDKIILWHFETDIECIGFVKSRFFWDDCFASIEVCSKHIVAKSRPVWVEVYGIPLSCWHGSFFLQVGRVLGVPLLIEEDTLKKKRLGKGKVLVLFPFESKCSEKIKVVEHSRSFELTIVRDDSKVDYDWIRSHLSLTNGNHKQVSETLENRRRRPEKFESQTPLLLAQKNPDKPDDSLSIRSARFVSRQKNRQEEGNFFLKNRDVRTQGFKKVVNPYQSQYKQDKVPINTEEPNIPNQLSKVESDEEVGPTADGLGSDHTVVAVSEMQSSTIGPDIPNTLDHIIDSHAQLKKIHNKEGTIHVLETGIKERQRHTASREEAIQLEIDLGLPIGRMEEEPQVFEVKDSHGLEKRRGSRKGGSINKHAMKTRNEKAGEEGSWNLAVEVVNVIEQQYCKKNGSLEGNMDSISLDEEIVKVIETGVTLGFDFEGREEDYTQILSQKEDEDNARLTPWKRRFLSKGGRLILIKAVLSSLPTYFLSVFKVPGGVAQMIERFQRNFFWGDGNAKRKIHSVDWETTCKNSKKGWLRHRQSPRQKQRIVSKMDLAVREGRKISVEEGYVRQVRDIGLRLSLEEACYHNRLVLHEGGGSWLGSTWVWNMALRRPLFDWEWDQWSSFQVLLDSVVSRKTIPDNFAWSFSVSSFRRQLEDYGDIDTMAAPFDSLMSWRGLCPPKIEVFVWQLLRGRVLVKGVLKRFGYKPSAGSARGSLQDWFTGWDVLCPLKSQVRAWRLCFLATVWFIWEHRNHVVFKDMKADMELLVDMIKFRMVWWFKHHSKGFFDPATSLLLNIADSCKDHKPINVSNKEPWIPPEEGCLKFNVDGSARGSPGPAGICGILRDTNGKVRCIFSISVGQQSSNTAKVLAVQKACHLCAYHADMGSKMIQIISDSKQVVSWVNEVGLGSLYHINLIMDIRECLSSMANASVVYNSRATNSLTDSLARKASESLVNRLEWSLE